MCDYVDAIWYACLIAQYERAERACIRITTHNSWM